MEAIKEALTFDDVLLLPRFSNILIDKFLKLGANGLCFVKDRISSYAIFIMQCWLLNSRSRPSVKGLPQAKTQPKLLV